MWSHQCQNYKNCPANQTQSRLQVSNFSRNPHTVGKAHEQKWSNSSSVFWQAYSVILSIDWPFKIQDILLNRVPAGFICPLLLLISFPQKFKIMYIPNQFRCLLLLFSYNFCFWMSWSKVRLLITHLTLFFQTQLPLSGLKETFSKALACNILQILIHWSELCIILFPG